MLHGEWAYESRICMWLLILADRKDLTPLEGALWIPDAAALV